LAVVIALLSAALTLFGTAVLRWWQYGRDAWNGRVDRVCSLVEIYIAKASEYWLLDIPLDKTVDGGDRRSITRLTSEAEIIGLGLQLRGLVETLSNRLTVTGEERISQALLALEEASQGGNFQSNAVSFDPNRARLIHSEGAKLIVAVRGAVDDAWAIRNSTPVRWGRQQQKAIKEQCKRWVKGPQ